MMKHSIAWQQSTFDEYLYWQQHDRKILKRINDLIKAIDRDPFEGIGKPESLKYILQGFWSRRITQEHRLVYCVDEKTITIISCQHHYNH